MQDLQDHMRRRSLAGLVLIAGSFALVFCLPLINPPPIELRLVSLAAMVLAAFGFYLILTRDKGVRPVCAHSHRGQPFPLPLTGRWTWRFLGGAATGAIVIGLLVVAFPDAVLSPFPFQVAGLVYYWSATAVLIALVVAAGVIAHSPPRH